ncbi:MAG TPA: spore protease YyaC [Syntrophomonadaceae bacterium]|nr:spore protease YyaC [Syntrophomonadaceae bacterium]
MKALWNALTKNECTYHYEHPACIHYIEQRIYELLCQYNPSHSRDLVFLCIGTDRATGDCLGPLVGTRLKSLHASAHVYGTLERPAHATNLHNVLGEIQDLFYDPLLVAVDASLGRVDRVGYINVREGCLKPGTALNKSLPEVGDFHVSGVVNVGGFLDQMVLQNTRLYVVHRMAENIARSLNFALLRFHHQRDKVLASD